MKCPGQDTLYWKPGAIFEAKCPKCGKEVEFFKDDKTDTASIKEVMHMLMVINQNVY